jgi:hypothetical protein
VTILLCLIPGYTNPLSSALNLVQAFLLYFMLPVFFTPFLVGRSFEKMLSEAVAHRDDLANGRNIMPLSSKL